VLHNFAVTFGKNCRGQIVTEAKMGRGVTCSFCAKTGQFGFE
jgi:hypothetical protein